MVPNEIRFSKPGSELCVDFADPRQPERMEVIAGRESLNPSESRVVKTASEDQVAVQPASTRGHLRERHPDLKRDPGLLREDFDGADRTDGGHDGVIQGSNCRRLALEMMGNRITAA